MRVIGMPLFMMLMNACRSLVCRWLIVPMHHLNPFVGSVADDGKVLPPILEICCRSATELF